MEAEDVSDNYIFTRYLSYLYILKFIYFSYIIECGNCFINCIIDTANLRSCLQKYIRNSTDRIKYTN